MKVARCDSTQIQDLRDNKTLVSSSEVFELGFFRTGGPSSSSYYLGIWFRDDPYKKPVWVANREYPLLDPSSVLSSGNSTVWESFYYPSDTFLSGMKLAFSI
ncbi:hypothetical protein NL676_035601 [Syzygium grande]|nr:hypothetical protein NL676_035601 [Syzygium grande]